MKTYKPNPANDIGYSGAIILCGATHEESGRHAWAIPGGTFTTSKREAARIASEVYKLRNKK